MKMDFFFKCVLLMRSDRRRMKGLFQHCFAVVLENPKLPEARREVEVLAHSEENKNEARLYLDEAKGNGQKHKVERVEINESSAVKRSQGRTVYGGRSKPCEGCVGTPPWKRRWRVRR